MNKEDLFGTKIMVRKGKESILVQKYLFNKGFSFTYNNKLIYSDIEYIFIYHDGMMTSGDTFDYFKLHVNRLIKVDNLLSPKDIIMNILNVNDEGVYYNE